MKWHCHRSQSASTTQVKDKRSCQRLHSLLAPPEAHKGVPKHPEMNLKDSSWLQLWNDGDILDERRQWDSSAGFHPACSLDAGVRRWSGLWLSCTLQGFVPVSEPWYRYSDIHKKDRVKQVIFQSSHSTGHAAGRGWAWWLTLERRSRRSELLKGMRVFITYNC